MWLLGFLLFPLIAGAPVEVKTPHYILQTDDNILTGVSQLDKSLAQLNISGQGIKGISKNAFQNVSHVKSLDLSKNLLSDLSDGAFSRLTNLEHLSLADNNLEHLDGQIFSGLNNLKSLNISNNPVYYLRSSNLFGFGKSTNVWTLGSQIGYINARVFEDPKLEDDLAKKLEEKYPTAILVQGPAQESKRVWILRNNRKIQACVTSEGSLERLEVLEVANKPQENCKEVRVDLSENTVWLNGLGIRSFVPGWYRLQEQPVDSLILKDNGIVSLTAEILKDLPATVTLVNLSGNKIERVEAGILPTDYAGALILQNNVISEIEDGAFDNTKLSALNLRGNRLKNTNFVAKLPTTLKQLLLGENLIDDLVPNAFSKLNNLLFLNLTGNQITVVKQESLRGLVSLDALILKKNKIGKIEPGAFQDLKALRRLELQGNGITDLEKGVFDGLLSVEFINLYYNNLTKVTSDSLHGLPDTLEELYFSFNQIKSLQTGTFVNVPKRELHFANNRIEKIEPGSFNLPTLKRLNLNDNLLSRLDNGDSFSGLPNLRYLDLQRNAITKIEKGSTKNLNGLFQLDISENPIKRLENGALFGIPKSHGTGVSVTNMPLELIQSGVFDDL